MILVFWRKISSRHSKGFPERGLKQGWGGKISGNTHLTTSLLKKNIGGYVRIVVPKNLHTKFEVCSS